jgi:hypothetical protein
VDVTDHPPAVGRSPTPGGEVAGLRLPTAPYVVLRLLGEGGMGRVYLGRSERGEHVALKVIRSDLAGEFGDALAVSGSNRGDFVCHGGTVFGSGPTLGYGQAIRVGGTVCTSRPSGMECRIDATRHGFALSRTRYTLF